MTADDKESVLVIGSDSLIGGALMAQLAFDGVRRNGTTRRPKAVTAGCSFLDLSQTLDEWRPCERASVAVICASVASIERCRLDPKATARVNVDGVCELSRKLIDDGTFVIFLSSNQVFDGLRPHRRPDDPTSARTEYGKQKAEVERYLLSLGHSVSIVRLTKVVPAPMPLLQNWRRGLSEGEVIHPFMDMVMAPISLSFAVTVLRKLIDARLPGIIQVSAESDITYAQAAYHIASRVGARSELIQPISVKEAGIGSDAAPEHTTLDTTRLRMELGTNPPDVWTTLDSAIGV